MDRCDEKKRCRSLDQIPETRRSLVISHVLAHAIRPVESRETNDGERHANSGCVQKKTLKQYTVREIEERDVFFMAARNF